MHVVKFGAFRRRTPQTSERKRVNCILWLKLKLSCVFL